MLSFADNYFFIEFTELLRTFSDICLSYYFNSFFIPLLGLFGAIIGGLLSYLGTHQVYKKQLQNERKNIAKAIDIDLNAISESVYFDIFYKIYKNGGKKIPEKIDQKFIDEKITLYSVFNHDIAKFDYDLSSKIYEFYNDLFTAESYRMFILHNKNLNDDITRTEIEIIDTIMKKLIVKCRDRIPEMRDELKKYTNLKLLNYLYLYTAF